MPELIYIVTLEVLITVNGVVYFSLTILESLVRGDRGSRWYVANYSIYVACIAPVSMASALSYVLLLVNRVEPLTPYSWTLTLICGFLLFLMGVSDYKLLRF